MDNFDHQLKILSLAAKWPADYFVDEASRREAERLALYLMGVADTYLTNGPEASTFPSLQRSTPLSKDEARRLRNFSYSSTF